MFSQDFQEFLETPSRHGVEFVLVGGYAFSLHERPGRVGSPNPREPRVPERCQ
jgi:hypothetical protein